MNIFLFFWKRLLKDHYKNVHNFLKKLSVLKSSKCDKHAYICKPLICVTRVHSTICFQEIYEFLAENTWIRNS